MTMGQTTPRTDDHAPHGHGHSPYCGRCLWDRPALHGGPTPTRVTTDAPCPSCGTLLRPSPRTDRRGVARITALTGVVGMGAPWHRRTRINCLDACLNAADGHRPTRVCVPRVEPVRPERRRDLLPRVPRSSINTGPARVSSPLQACSAGADTTGMGRRKGKVLRRGTRPRPAKGSTLSPSASFFLRNAGAPTDTSLYRIRLYT